MTVEVRLGLDAEPTAPRLARRAVTDALADDPRVDDLALCVSEVVTNAVLHGAAPILFHLQALGEVVRIEVADASPVPPIRKYYEDLAPTGRGLHLLDRLTSAWGVEPDGTGKIVWFEMDRPA